MNAIQRYWRNRKKYSGYSSMPDYLVMMFGASSFLVAGFYGYVLSQALPEYLNVANHLPIAEWGAIGWLLTVILGALALLVWLFGNVAWKCNEILRNRWYR